VARGGHRPGAGRKPLPPEQRSESYRRRRERQELLAGPRRCAHCGGENQRRRSDYCRERCEVRARRRIAAGLPADAFSGEHGARGRSFTGGTPEVRKLADELGLIEADLDALVRMKRAGVSADDALVELRRRLDQGG
jgi:hypothetical protein